MVLSQRPARRRLTASTWQARRPSAMSAGIDWSRRRRVAGSFSQRASVSGL
jgi:hypothetical protein